MKEGEILQLKYNAQIHINCESLRAYRNGFLRVVGLPFYTPTDDQFVTLSDDNSLALVFSTNGFKLVCLVIGSTLDPILAPIHINENNSANPVDSTVRKAVKSKPVWHLVLLKIIKFIDGWLDIHNNNSKRKG